MEIYRLRECESFYIFAAEKLIADIGRVTGTIPAVTVVVMSEPKGVMANGTWCRI